MRVYQILTCHVSSGPPAVSPFSVLAGNCHMRAITWLELTILAAAILRQQQQKQQQQQQLSSSQQRLAESKISTPNAGKSSFVYTYKWYFNFKSSAVVIDWYTTVQTTGLQSSEVCNCTVSHWSHQAIRYIIEIVAFINLEMRSNPCVYREKIAVAYFLKLMVTVNDHISLMTFEPSTFLTHIICQIK